MVQKDIERTLDKGRGERSVGDDCTSIRRKVHLIGQGKTAPTYL